METKVRTIIEVLEGSQPDTPKHIDPDTEYETWDELLTCNETLLYEWYSYHYKTLRYLIRHHAETTQTQQKWRCTDIVEIPQDMLNTRIIEIEEVDILAKTDGEIEQTSELYPVSIQESNRLLKTAVS